MTFGCEHDPGGDLFSRVICACGDMHCHCSLCGAQRDACSEFHTVWVPSEIDGCEQAAVPMPEEES